MQNNHSVNLKLKFKFNKLTLNNMGPLEECQSHYRKMVSDVSLGLKPQEILNNVPNCFYPIYVLFYLDSNAHERKNFLYMVTLDNKMNSESQYIINKNVEISGIVSLPVPKNMKLCVQVYITTLSETGAQCKVDFGNVVIDILSLLQDTTNSNDIEKRFDLKLHSVCGNPIKSNISISATNLSIMHTTQTNNNNNNVRVTKDLIFYPGTKDIRIFNNKLEPWANSKDNYFNGLKAMSEYLKATSSFNERLVKFMKGKRITCPTNPGQVTLENTDLALPVVSFLYSQNLEATESFFVHELTIYATRYLISKKKWAQENYHYIRDSNYDSIVVLRHFEKYFFESTINERASITVNFLSQYVQMLEYVTDLNIQYNMKQNVEIFGDAITCQCGDCEDFVCSIYQLIKCFQTFNFTTFTKIFDEMKRILSGCVPMATIMGVTTNSIQYAKKQVSDDDNENDDNNDKNEGNYSKKLPKKIPPKIASGHAALVLLPLSHFYKYLYRWSPDHKLTMQIKSEMTEFLKKNQDMTNLTVLIGEGTGMFESGVLKDELQDQREEFFETCSTIEKIKKPIIPSDRKESPFYSSLIFGFTDKYIETNKIGTFYFTTMNYKNNYVIKKPKYYNSGFTQGSNFGEGCTFEDFISEDKNVAIVPNLCNSSVPLSCEFDSFMLNMMKDVSKTRVPLPKLKVVNTHIENIKICAAVQKIKEEKQSCEIDFDAIKCYHSFTTIEAEMLLDFLAKINQHPKIKKNSKNPLDSVLCFYLLEDYIDETLVDSIKEFVISSQFNICGIEIYKEYHTEDFFVYRVDILYCK